MIYDTVIYNGLIVTGYDILPTTTYIGILNGKIDTISASPLEGKRLIDCKGGFVTPGGVDPHVHLEEPNSIYCDTFEHATRIAISGGTTTVIAFALQGPGDDDEKSTIVEDTSKYMDRAKGQCYSDYGFHLIVRNPSNPLISQLSKLVEMGLTSCKIYTTYDSLKLNDYQILTILLETRKLGMTQMIHAENTDIIAFLNNKLEAQNLLSPYYHAVSRPVEAEDEASYRVIQLSKIINIPILIVHMSSPQALCHVKRAQEKLIPIYAETCPQYLFLTNSLMKAHEHEDPFTGAKYICSPPLRDDSKDLEGVWEAIANGTVTVFSSDHAPSNYDDYKGKKLGLDEHGNPDYKKIPNGLSGVEVRMPLLWTHGVTKGRITPQRFVQITATNPAKLYGLDGVKGSISPGYDADLIIWHPENTIRFNIENDKLEQKFDYTAFDGVEVTNWPRYTLLRGQVVYDRDNGGVVVEKGVGEYLKRGKSSLGGKLKELDPILS